MGGLISVSMGRHVALGLLAVFLISIPPASALACEGSVIFTDDFSDNTGGWNSAPYASINNSELIIRSGPKQNNKVLNIANTFTDADVCVDALFPKYEPSTSAGLMVWAEDFANFYALQLQPNGSVGIWRLQNGKWYALRPNAFDSSVRTGAGQINTLRVRAMGNVLKFFVNDREIREVKGVAPGEWHVGLDVESDGNKDSTVIFEHVKVTSVDSVRSPVSDSARKNSTYTALDLFEDVFERIRADYVVKPSDWKLVDAAISGMVKGTEESNFETDESGLCRGRLTRHTTYDALQCFGIVFEQVHKASHVAIDDTRLVEGAVNAMTASLDAHSSYIGAEDYRNQQLQARGEFGGIGVELTLDYGRIEVISPIGNFSAARAGIRPGDSIINIDGQSVQGLSLEGAVRKLQGPLGSVVRLRIVRKSVEQPLDIAVPREHVDVQPVFVKAMGGVIYIRVTQFNNATTSELQHSIANLKKKLGERKIEGYVLDLRNDPGGLLDQAISVTNVFLPKGEILMERGRGAEQTQRFDADPKGAQVGDKPLIVLINSGSAGASEIVAAALQDHRRATVVGARSFGMGTVQTIIPLGLKGVSQQIAGAAQSTIAATGNEGALRLTTSRDYTPSGRGLEGAGVMPDILVNSEQQKITADLPTKDKTLQMAIDLLDGVAKNAAFPPDPKKLPPE